MALRAVAGGAHRGAPVKLPRALANLPEPERDQFFDERLRQRTVDWEVEGALGHRVALNLIGKLRQDGAAEREVTQMVRERGKAGNCLTFYTERWDAVRDHLFGVWDDLENSSAQCLKRAALRLIDCPQVLVNLLGVHGFGVYARFSRPKPNVPAATICALPPTSTDSIRSEVPVAFA